MKLSLEIYANDDVMVVGCKGRVYGPEADSLSSHVKEFLPGARMLVLDLSQVEAIDGAGLGALLALLNAAHDHDCLLKLAAPSPHVLGLLQLTNLHNVFDIYPTLENAMLSSRGQVA